MNHSYLLGRFQVSLYLDFLLVIYHNVLIIQDLVLFMAVLSNSGNVGTMAWWILDKPPYTVYGIADFEWLPVGHGGCHFHGAYGAGGCHGWLKSPKKINKRNGYGYHDPAETHMTHKSKP